MRGENDLCGAAGNGRPDFLHDQVEGPRIQTVFNFLHDQ